MIENYRLTEELNSITTGFHSEHEKLQSLLNNLENYKEKNENKGEVFRYIRWQLKKNFYLEEKFLFHSKHSEILNSKITRALMQQHDKLLEACEIVENCKGMQTGAKMRKFQELLKAHFDFEKNYVYRIFQEKLSREQIQHVLGNIAKASNLGFYPLNDLRKYNKGLMKSKSGANQRNTMKALNKIHVKKLLRSLLRSQKSTSTIPPSN